MGDVGDGAPPPPEVGAFGDGVTTGLSVLGSAEGSLDGDGGGAAPPPEVGGGLHTLAPRPHTVCPPGQSVKSVAQQFLHLLVPLDGLQAVPGAASPGGFPDPGVGLGLGHW